MSANPLPSPARTKRLERIAEAFRRGGASSPATDDAALPPDSTGAAKSGATIRPDGSMLVTPAWLNEALADRGGRRERTHSEFSHLHRRLGKGEAIPPVPSLLEQIVGLSHLLAQHPLSQQEEEALRGEEDQQALAAGPVGGGTDVSVEDEEAALV
jgi:hypothetical protein